MNQLALFHFIRPEYLLLIPILLLFCWWLSQQRHQQTGFEQWIDKHLLSHICTHQQQTRSVFPYYLLAAIWLVTTLALAGPTWKQLPQPLHQSEQAMVIILDLSPSMLAQDNKPSRIVRARLKIQDLLTQRQEGLTALVVYSGEAHTVTPLTDDTRTIINLLPTLAPGLLPIPGSNIEMAFEVSQKLLKDSGINNAAFVVVTDGIDESAIAPITQQLNPLTQLFILGVGTTKGAPIPTTNNTGQQSGFLRDKNNQIVTAKRNDALMEQFAQANNGYYLPLRADNGDTDFINNHITEPLDKQSRQLERQADQWEEFGPTLLLLLLPFIALSFRRGWLLVSVLTITPLLSPHHAYALSWNELWLNKNQRAQQAFEQRDYEGAEKQFNHSQWKGSAAYKNKDYQSALEAFSQGESATDYYNKGNSLAQLGRFDEAIEAYNNALEKQPSLEDAKKNKQLIEEIKKQQEQSQESQDQDSSQKSDQQQQNSEQNQQQDSQQSSSQQPSESKQDQQGGSQQEQQNSTEAKQDSAKAQPEEKQTAESSAQEQEKSIAQDKDKQEENTDTKDQAQNNTALAKLNSEERRELEQWLRKIPDDPSGLLRRKFEYEFQKRRQLYQEGKWALPKNNAHERY